MKCKQLEKEYDAQIEDKKRKEQLDMERQQNDFNRTCREYILNEEK